MYNFYKETIISVFKNKNVVTMGFISGVSGFMIESLFDHTWYNYRVVLIFWIVIALGILSTRFSIKEEK